MQIPWVGLVFCAYFAVLIVMASVRSGRMRDMEEYALGGRRLSSVTAALSAGASATSAWTILSLPALAFTNGAMAMWIPTSSAIGIWLSWRVLAKRLRRYTIDAEALTIPEFLEARFDDRSGVLRGLAAVVTVLFVTVYVSSGFVAGSKLLETVFGTGPATGVLLTFAGIGSYIFIGGFTAVSRTDVFQALLMLGCPLVMTAALLGSTGNAMGTAGATAAGFLNPFTDTAGAPLTTGFVLSTAGWGLGAFGSQRTLQRFMALEREDRHVVSRRMSMTWLLAVFVCAIAIGLLARGALSEAGISQALSDAEQVYMAVSEALFHPVVTGMLLTAVIAAVMSTADSQLLLASAVATEDLPLVKRIAANSGGGTRVWWGRVLLVAIGSVGAAVAVAYPESVLDLVSYAWGGMGAAFGPVTILALWWRRFNYCGAMASMATGTLVASVWWYLDGGPSGVWDIHPATPGFLISMSVAVVVASMTPKPADEVVARFDRVNSDEREE